MWWPEAVWGRWFCLVLTLLSATVGLLFLALKPTAFAQISAHAALPFSAHREVIKFLRTAQSARTPLPETTGHAIRGTKQPPDAQTPRGLRSCVEKCTASLAPRKPREFPVEGLVQGYSQSKFWFPTGFDSFESIIRHDLRKVPNISKTMVDRAWCVGPDPFQGVVNWQMANGSLLREHHRIGDQFEDRVNNGLRLLRKALPLNKSRSGDVDMVLYWADIPPDLERGRLNPDRKCHPIHPFFVYQKQEALNNPSSMVFPDPGFVHWAEGRRKILTAAEKLTWSTKTGKLLFRGNDAGYRAALDKKWLQKKYPASFDIFKVDVNDVKGRMSRDEQCNFKYLLYMPGFWGTISTRLRWLMACGSVVVVPKHDWYEFFYPLLKPFEHFVPAGNMRLTRGHDLPCITDCLRTHDEEAKQIAENANRFVRDVLTEDVAERYISLLFSVYSRHMGYNASSFTTRDPTRCNCPK